jgi:hypothetical protein
MLDVISAMLDLAVPALQLSPLVTITIMVMPSEVVIVVLAVQALATVQSMRIVKL